MTANIIDGKSIANSIKEDIKNKVSNLISKGKSLPCLAVILVGDDPASKVYVSHKEKACAATGIKSLTYRLDKTANQNEVLSLINQLNSDNNVHGILLQLPIPSHLNERTCIEAISPIKDVDGLGPLNQGRLLARQKAINPCTPSGILHLIKTIEPNLSGKIAAVIGRSVLVGKPIRLLLENEGCTIISIHSKTIEPSTLTKLADIVVAAAGVPKLVTAKWVKPGAIVIDVGMHRNGKRLIGDVDFEDVSKTAGSITPVPGGVGPMTIAMLMNNCLDAYNLSQI